MTTKLPEKTREGILAMLMEKRSYREIQAKYQVAPATISQVKREAHLPIRKTPPPAPLPTAPGQEGNGLAEFQPPAEAKKQAPAPAEKQAESASEASANGNEAEVYGCGACGVEWTLDEGEKQVQACPGCGVAL